jgi:hypothetical protein
MENVTQFSSESWSNGSEKNLDCNDLTNNGLYLIFVGYLLPFLSPKVRDYGKEVLSVFRNMGRVASDVVSLTEFGFDKIQGLSNNDEMSAFIQRLSDKKNMNVLSSQIQEIAWSFSGDTQNGSKDHKQETWKKLLNELDRTSILNKMDRSNKKTKP